VSAPGVSSAAMFSLPNRTYRPAQRSPGLGLPASRRWTRPPRLPTPLRCAGRFSCGCPQGPPWHGDVRRDVRASQRGARTSSLDLRVVAPPTGAIRVARARPEGAPPSVDLTNSTSHPGVGTIAYRSPRWCGNDPGRTFRGAPDRMA